MQSTVYLNQDEVGEFLYKAFSVGEAVGYTKDSDPGEDISLFAKAEEVLVAMEHRFQQRSFFWGIAMHYAITKGYVDLHRIDFTKPTKDGSTYRYTTRGWGLIFIQLTRTPTIGAKIEVFISSNTETRARKWYDAYPELFNPNLWDWNAVNSISRKLREFVKRYPIDRPVCDNGNPPMEAVPNAAGDIKCPCCGTHFSIHNKASWLGWGHKKCGQRIIILEKAQP